MRRRPLPATDLCLDDYEAPMENSPSHGAEALLGGVGIEIESTQLVLDLALGLVVARGGRVGGVLLKIAKGVEEGALMSLGLPEVLLLESLLC